MGVPKPQETKEQLEDVINKIEIRENEETGNDDVKDLLQKYKQVFAKKKSQGIEGMLHKLEVTDDTPIRQRPYKTDIRSQEAIDKIVDELLEQGIIEESESDWCSPVLLVKKKDSQMRLVVDYKKKGRVATSKNTRDF